MKKSEKTRTGRIKRATKETRIDLTLKLDGRGKYSISTNEPFLTHMLEQLSKHSGISMNIKAKGDVEIDSHHLAEDTGIALGMALNAALETKKGIKRFGSAGVLDEALVRVALDVSGRPYADINLDLKVKRIGSFDTELVEEFFRGIASGGMLTLHIDRLKGKNTHHIIEAAFKGFAVSLREAVSVCGSSVASTKGRIGK
ncbi:MAG TPA: imidazoleglycerol-phosphate dehydratase HisB [Firmicutes bacterium]|nr:imidazoleglycerol-phosphate dehydratase HisB [Bacillota bacterium]